MTKKKSLKVGNKNIQLIFFLFICSVALTTVSSVTIIIPPIFYIPLLSLFMYFVFYPKIDKQSIHFLVFCMSPYLISLLSTGYIYINPDIRFSEIDGGFWIGRLINLILLCIFFLVAISLFLDERHGRKYYNFFLKSYLFGCLLLLFTAIWQFIASHTGFINFPFETRSHIHSEGAVVLNSSVRLTGLAAEPSYLTPFMVDLIAISILIYGWHFKSVLITGLAILVIIFSLSPTGYVVLFGATLLTFFILVIKYRNPIGINIWLLVAIVFPFVLGIGVYLLDSNFIEYIYVRLVEFDPENSSRAYMNFMVPYWLLDGSWERILIGYGLKSYSLIGEYYLLPNGTPVHITSNNLFVDTLWEAGFIGLFILIAFFVYLFYLLINLNINKKTKIILLFYFFDVFLSSLVRADFASPRFFVFLIIIFAVIRKRDLLES